MKTVFEKRASAICYRLALAMSRQQGVHILPANICFSVPLAILMAGGQVEFIDIDPATYSLDEALLFKRLRNLTLPKVACVYYVRGYGSMAGAPNFNQIKALSSGTVIIDDRCLSVPEPEIGECEPQGADVCLYSTGYSKYVDLGFGGFAHFFSCVPYDEGDVSLAFSKDRYEQINQTIQKAQIDHARFDLDLNTGWLDLAAPDTSFEDYKKTVLAKIPRVRRHKKTINQLYKTELSRGRTLADRFQHWRYNVIIEDRDKILKEIFKAQLFASKHYMVTANLFDLGEYRVAEYVAQNILNLVNDLYITKEQAVKVVQVINAFETMSGGTPNI